MKTKNRIGWAALIICFLASAFFARFYVYPRRLFRLGMSAQEIDAALRHQCELVPLNTAFSSPPLPEELQTTPVYEIDIATMGAKIHLNSFKRVVHVHFLLGEDRGRLILTPPNSK